jgi:hypothetical protein
MPTAIFAADYQKNASAADIDNLTEAMLALYVETTDRANDLADEFANRAPEGPGAFRAADGTVYRAQTAKGSGHLYAKVLKGTEWVYVSGAIYSVREADRLTLEQAADISALLGECVICGRTLTASKSVLAGIGPVCRKRVAF